MKKLIIQLFLDYYFIGTVFLLMYLNGNVVIQPREKISKFQYTYAVLGLCFYWPILIYMIKKGNDKK